MDQTGRRRILECESITHDVIGAAIEVHMRLGPGLLESAYQACLVHELSDRGLDAVCEWPLPVTYKGLTIECGYRLDLVVEGSVVLELKSVEKILPVHEAQLMTYLRLARLPVGLLVNFNVNVLKDGIVRRANTQNPLRDLRDLRGATSGEAP